MRLRAIQVLLRLQHAAAAARHSVHGISKSSLLTWYTDIMLLLAMQVLLRLQHAYAAAGHIVHAAVHAGARHTLGRQA